MLNRIQGKQGQAAGQVLPCEEGGLQRFGGKGTGGQGGHGSDATDLRVPRFRADGLCTLCITGKTLCGRGKWAQVSRPSDRFSRVRCAPGG